MCWGLFNKSPYRTYSRSWLSQIHLVQNCPLINGRQNFAVGNTQLLWVAVVTPRTGQEYVWSRKKTIYKDISLACIAKI